MIVLHEFAHKELHEMSWGLPDDPLSAYDDAQIGPEGSWIRDGSRYDKDADGIKDSWETDNWGQPNFVEENIPPIDWPRYQYWQNQQYDGNSFQTDHEFYADMEGARNWQVGSLDSQDWANPGKQSEPRY